MHVKKFFIIAIILFLTASSSLRAQEWEQIGWQGEMSPQVQLGNTLFGKGGNGIYKSTDWGKSWTSFRRGLPINNTIYANGVLLTDGHFLYLKVDVDSGLYFCRETDTVWSFKTYLKINNEYTSVIFPRDSILLLLPQQQNIFDSAHGIFFSLDSGKTWEKRMDSLGQNISISTLLHIGNSFFTECKYTDSLFVERYYIYRTNNYGKNWQKITMPEGNHFKYNISPLPNQGLFLTIYHDNYPLPNQVKFYRSSDLGETWDESEISLDMEYINNIESPVKIGSKLYLYVHKNIPYKWFTSIFTSDDNALHWRLLDSVEAFSVRIFAKKNNYILSVSLPNGNYITDSTFRKMKAEKYIITTEGSANPARISRMGFGPAGEEVQKFLADGAILVRVHVVGPGKECTFAKEKGKDPRLHDIKQRIKSLTFPD